jgi:hypothetical protein
VNENKRNAFFGGKLTPGTATKVVAIQAEPWTEYLLDDGTILRLKVMLFEATRVDDAYEQDGTPVYAAKWGVVQHAQAPDSLKRAPT